MRQKIIIAILILLMISAAYAATRSLVPRADGEGGLGTSAKNWLSAYIDTVYTDVLDTIGAADMDYGSADVTDHTFTTDGTGDSEFVVPNDSIGNAELDWGSMTDLTTNGAISANAVQGTDIAIASEAAGDVMYHNGTDWIRLAKGTAGQVLELSADANVPEWDTDDDSGGATAWDDVTDPDNSGLTTITFDNAELSLLTGDNDAAASFFTIQNSDADHTGGNLYLLDLDYSADDGDADADFIKCQDSGGVVFSVQQDGDLVSIGTVDLNPAHTSTATIADITPSAVISTNEADWRGVLINGAALDPSGDDVLICGMHIDLSGVVPSGTGGDIDGIKLQMADGGKHAIHSEEGKIVIDNTAGSAVGAEYTVVDIRLDTNSLNANSEVHAIDVAIEAGTPSGKVVAMGTHTNVNPIAQSIGTFSTPSQTEYAGERHTGGTVWVDGVDGSEIFVADDDAVYVGSAAVFNEIEVDMATAATKSVTPTFHYNTAADTWTQFFPADDTDGFQQDGTVRWDLGDISGSWTSDGDPCGVETSTGYWIKIVRTANADPGTPTPTTVKTGVITSYEWDKTGAIDVLSLEADTITEGGIAVHNNDQMDASSELLAIFDDETGTGVIVFGTAPSFTTSINAVSQASIGTTSTEFGDIFIGDGKALKMGDDQDVTITHVADTGVQVELDDSIMFGDTAVFIESDDDGYLDLDADTGIRLNAATASTGTITAVGSFIIGAADMAEADLEKLDGITNGTAAANKALVLGASGEIATITTATITTATITNNIKSTPRHMIFNIINPLATQTEDNEICLWPVTPADLTVTNIVVTLDAAANEVAGDLKWADAFIGLAGATVINDFDTTSGVRSDSSITAGTVAAGKCMYIAFDSAPNTAITQMCVDITFSYD